MTHSRFIRFALLLLLFTQMAGCRSVPAYLCCAGTEDLAVVGQPSQMSGLAAANCAYALGLKAEEKCQATCVDYYFQAITLVWPDVEQELKATGKSTGPSNDVYQNSLNKLIDCGQKFGRLIPSRGLEVQIGQQTTFVPINYLGFLWRGDDFDSLVTVSQTSSKKLTNWYRWDGLGVAMVAFHDQRPGELFRQKKQAFAATAIVRPVSDQIGNDRCFELVFTDPLRVDSIDLCGTKVAVERNLTAPIALAVSKRDKSGIEDFIHPGASTSNLGLFQLEPYQPGKIPVLFIHGLMSDPLTWANIANEMRARPELMNRYQVWGFEYATGEPFLVGASVLRKQLTQLHADLNQQGYDPALQSMVLVGHSMGGLVTKLMVTHSGTELWNSTSCRPLEQINAPTELRNSLAESFFFEPLPFISRAVFVGTPHRGSPWAVRPAGRIAAKLVEEPESMKTEHERLINDNPGVFSREFSRRIPTSIDLLKPTSPLLESMNRIPFCENVKRHSVIGSGYFLLGGGNSDRIVPVTSARLNPVVTERMIHAKHTELNANPNAIEELFCILKQHVRECSSNALSAPVVADRFFD